MEEKARLGVFICECGDEIAGLLDLPRLGKRVKTLPGVAVVQKHLYPCSKDGLKEIGQAIRDHKINRVVVAGCSPRIYGPLFRSACEEAGLEGPLCEMVNIRDQCCRVHLNQRKEATRKAERLIEMAAVKIAQIQQGRKLKAKINPSVLIVGGGISGMTAALTLASQGISVKLVEKEKELGGQLKHVYSLYPSFGKSSELIGDKIREVQESSGIELLLQSTIAKVGGRAGEYRVTVRREARDYDCTVGSIIVATGAESYEPRGRYGYGKNERVTTQLGLERLLATDSLQLVSGNSVVMIQCVGSRIRSRPYCSRICCMTAIKNSILLKQGHANLEVTILFRDLQTFGGLLEKDILRARDMGVSFLRYRPSDQPRVKEKTVSVLDELSGKEVTVPYDLLVLSTPLVPKDDVKELATVMRITTDRDGFVPDVHIRLKPTSSISSAIYPCGCAHWPATISESILQAYYAGSKAAQFLRRQSISADWPVPSVFEERCRECGWCVEVCRFGALEMRETDDGGRLAHIDPVMCKACGVCAVTCPSGAIVPTHYRSEQIGAMVEAGVG